MHLIGNEGDTVDFRSVALAGSNDIFGIALMHDDHAVIPARHDLLIVAHLNVDARYAARIGLVQTLE